MLDSLSKKTQDSILLKKNKNHLIKSFEKAGNVRTTDK